MKRTTKIIAATVLLCLLFAGNVNAVTKIWSSAGGGNWNVAGNWSPAGVPASGDDVQFNSGGNCNIDIAVNVNTITVNGYTNTITQNGFSITINSNAGNAFFFQSGTATFTGGTAFINDLGGFNLQAGTFNCPSDTFFVKGAFFTVNNTGATFNCGTSGKVELAPTGGTAFTVTGLSGITFNKLDIRTNTIAAVTYTLPTLTVNDTFFLSGSQFYYLNTGTINLKKDLKNLSTANALGTCPGGSATIIFNSTNPAITQTLIGPPSQGSLVRTGPLPAVTINTAGTFKIIDTSTVLGNWTYTSGTMKCPGMITFTCSANIDGFTHTLSHCQFTTGTRTLASNVNLYVDSAMTVGPGAAIWDKDTIYMVAQSTITTTGSAFSGGGITTWVVINGTGTQKIIGNANEESNCLPNVEIRKAAADNLILTTSNTVNGGLDYIGVFGNWRYTSGTITGNGKVDFMSGYQGPQFIYGTHTLPNVIFAAAATTNSYVKVIHTGDILTVSGNAYTFGPGPQRIDSGQVNVNGNFVVRNTGTGLGGTTLFNFIGTNTQYFDCDASIITPSPPMGIGSAPILGNGKVGPIAITKTGGTLIMRDSVTVNGNWDYYSGTVDATTNRSLRNFVGTGYHINGTNGANTMGFDTVVLGDANVRNVTGNFNVAHLLDLRTGILDLLAHKVKVQSSWVNAVKRTSGMIKSETNSTIGYGTLDWQIGNAAAGSAYVYPFGIDIFQYVPFTYTVTTPGSTATGSLAVSTYPTQWTLAPNNRPLPTGITNLNSPVSGIDNSPKALDRFWITTPNNYGTVPVGTVQVTYRDSEWQYPTNNILEPQMQLTSWNSSTSTWSFPNNTTTLNTTTNIASITNQGNSNLTAYILSDTARPHFLIASTDTTVCAGEYVTFYDLHAVSPPTTYSWSFPGGTPSTSSDPQPVIQYLTPGVYNVSVTGTYPGGGTISDAFTNFITVVTGPTVVKDSTNPSCSGGCTGVARLTISTPPTHTINWYQLPNTTTSLANIDQLTSRCTGSYMARVRMTGGCTFRDTFNLTSPLPITATVTSHTNLLCNSTNIGSSCNGAISLSASGGSPGPSGYTYTWSPGGLLGSSRTGLCAGIYIITVSDGGSCTTVVRDTITQPAAVSAAVSAFANPTCSGLCNGSATVTVTGGTGSTTHRWTPNASGQTTAAITNLCGGIYIDTVRDVNGCADTAKVTLTAPTGITASVQSDSNVTCFGLCNGRIVFTASGGAAPLNHHLSNSTVTAGNTATFTGLCAGIYHDTIMDANGCFVILDDTIYQPALLTVSVTSQTNVTCNGLCNGKAKVTAVGGRGPNYTYVWSPTGGTNDSITGKCAGTYTVTVKDMSLPAASACTATASVTITEPAALVATISASTNVTCFGACNGTANGSFTGGTGPTYTHHWNTTPVQQVTGQATGLCPGSYVDTIFDNNGCKAFTAPVVITQPTALTATATGHANATCNGACNGAITANPSGGTGPTYTHHWSGPAAFTATTATISSLCAGAYADTIKDVNGCVFILRDTITQPSVLSLTLVSKTNLSCGGVCNGKIITVASGGTPSYHHYWSTGRNISITPTDSIVALCVGHYADTVKDANGCIAIYVDSITSPTALSATVTAQINDSCFGQCNGSATVTGSGGSGSYGHSWTGPGGFVSTSATITGLCVGTYTDNVTDLNAPACVVPVQVIITQPVVLSGSIASQTNVSCFGFCDGKAKVTGAGGTTFASGLYHFLWSTGSITDSATALCQGTYTVTITDKNNCSTIVSVTITQPVSMSHNIAVRNNVTCFGACDGKIAETVSGGGGTYTFTWTPVSTTHSGTATTDTARNLCPGTYSVTVRDNNGCTVSDTATITQPTQLTASITRHINDSCFNQCNGRITVTPLGGSNGYTHYWNNGVIQVTTGDITGLCAGIYVDTIRDGNGCQIIVKDTITAPPVLTSTFTATSNASCSGRCDGRATVTPAGGTPPYTVLWSNGPTSLTDSSLCVGTYRVTVTDHNGCNTVDSIAISEPAPLVATVTAFTNITCFGANNGTATVTTTGGTPVSPGVYSHHWNTSPLQFSSPATGLHAGTWIDSVTDSHGCYDTASVTITEPTQLTATTNNTLISCGSQCDGVARVIPAGGTVPYTHSWSLPGGHADTLANLCAGIYTDTVKDANGCTIIVRDTVTAPPLLSDSIVSKNISCHGACDGKARVYPYGGNPGTTPPYTIVWSTGATIDSITNQCPGTYRVTITDSRSCDRIDSVTITEPAVLAITGVTGINTSCYLVCNGKAWVTVTGGTTPYSYLWNNGLRTDTITALCAGHYHVTVTDAHGCFTEDSITITEPLPITVTVDSIHNVSCHGLCDGKGYISVSGGTSGYTFVWSTTPPQTTEDPIGLCAGTYTVTITDSHGCSTTSSITITEPSVLQASVTTTINVSCHGQCDGQIIVAGNGGTPPYTYLWNTTPPQTGGPSATDTIIGLCAGTYRVTVTDSNNCTVVLTDTVTQPPTLSILRNNITNITCNGLCNGGAKPIPTGGTLPYNHHWSNGPITDTINAVCAGTYYDTIIDGRGCIVIDSITITQPAPLVDTMRNIVNTSCYNLCNGRATAGPSGGTAPYTYVWSNGPTSPTDTNLCAGTYKVTITDAHGCITVDSVTITQPTQLTATITSSTNLLCNGVCTGQAVVVAAGGTPFGVGLPYHYSWNAPGVPQTRDTAINLCAGVDSVTVTDANGCIAKNFVTITEPPVLRDSFTLHTDVSCFGICDGKLRVTGLGGTGLYSYQWSGGSTLDSITSLCAGNYPVIITDANNCTVRDSATITQPTVLTANINTSTNASCNGVCNGKAKVTAAGGTIPYQYLWNNPAGSTTDSAVALCAGTYIVTVTDAHGCTAFDTVTITEPPVLHDSITAFTNVKCHGVCIGTATDSAWGGTSPYFYAWSTSPTQSTATATGLCAGTYVVTTTDFNGCTVTASVTITEPALLVSRIDSFANDSCNAQCNGFARTLTTGGTGGTYTYSWNTPSPQTTLSVNNLCAGTFIVTVKDSNQCTVFDTVTITQPTPITLVTHQTDVTCNGANDGKAGVLATGGNGSYHYAWSTGTVAPGVGDSVTGLSPGVVTVTVTDLNLCTAVATITITEPAVLVATATGSNVKCFGGNSGKAWASQTGGTPDVNGLYRYTWSGGTQIGNGDTVVNLIAGTYYVTVTDAHGCTDSASITITQPLAPVSDTITTSNVRCHGGNDGGAHAHVQGGTAPYTYAWSCGFPVGGGDSVGGLVAGSCLVTVTDANGCSLVNNFTITEPVELLLTIRVDSNTNCNAPTGGLTVCLTGGTTPYSYAWSPAGGSTPNSPLTCNSASGLGVGQYTVVVTDSQGCSKQIIASIQFKPNPILDSAIMTQTTCSQNNGAIDLFAHTGNPPLTYDWTPTVSTSSSASSLAAGDYTIVIRDASGCDTTATVTVTTIAKLHVDTVIVKDAYCGHEDGKIQLFVSLGTLPYTFAWSHDGNLNSSTASPLIPGSYVVTVTDANNCDTILSFNILDIPKPIITIMPDTAVKIHKGQSVDVAVTLVSSPDSVVYVWNTTAGLSCDSCPNPVAKPEQTTTYMVQAIDSVTGCYDSTFITIIVKDADNFFIPNGITPNGDGVNDVWMIRELYYCPENEVVILNRWGDEVFRAKPYQNDWGGTYNGKQLPAGTYYYIIKLDCTGESLSGPITIIR